MATTKLDYKLLPAQRDYMKHRNAKVWAFAAAIGSGKTFVTMLDLCMRVVKSGERWLVGSQTWSTTRTIQFKQITEFLDSWGVNYDYDKSKLILTLPNGGEVRGCCSSAENSVTGATLYHGALFDEAYLWDNDARLYIEGRCRGRDPKTGELIKPKYRYVGSPPLEPLGWYYDFLKTNPDKVTHSSMLECEGLTLSREYIQAQIEAYGGESSPLCRIQCFGELPDESSAASIFRREHKPKEIQVSMGVDVAQGEGGDEAYFIVTDGLEIIHESSMNEFTQKELLAHALDVYRRFHVQASRVDTTGGFGTYLVEAMGDNGCNVEGVNFGQRANDSESYLNARAEMYVNAANHWSDSWGDLCKQERLATGFTMSKTGKLEIISKEIIKKVIGKSPDKLDALCLALYDNGRGFIPPIDKGLLEDIDNMLFELNG